MQFQHLVELGDFEVWVVEKTMKMIEGARLIVDSCL